MSKYLAVVDYIRTLFPDREFIPLHEPYFGGNEKNYVLDCIDSTFVSSVGKYVELFEQSICEYTGAKYAVATVNGTAALHIAMLISGVGRGDMVITQPLTFIATCNAISYCGAQPVFVDIDRATLGLSPVALESWLLQNAVVEDGICYYQPLITYEKNDAYATKAGSTERKKISACVPMHTFGHPCKIDEIVRVCSSFNIPVIEDAAESIGSYYKNKHTGIFGKIGTFSFNGNKTITTGGGGMIVTNDKQLAVLAKHLTTQAKVPHPWEFVHDHIGYNYRMPNINAALGCAQLEMIDALVESKRALSESYKTFFSSSTDIDFLADSPDTVSNYWLNAILLKDKSERDAFLQYANDHGVMSRPAWTLMNNLMMFKGCVKGELTTAQDIENRLVNIPSSARIK